MALATYFSYRRAASARGFVIIGDRVNFLLGDY
jgi:hypothetical protein